MKKIAAFLLILVVAGCGLYSKSKKVSLHTPIAVTENKPIVVVIPSYNNSNFCEENLASVFNQKYSNYRVIYVDDCSTDGTYEKVKAYIALQQQEPRVTLVRNEKRCTALENLYRAIHTCADHEIVAILDGDDYFAHTGVLEILNKNYNDPNVWMTYGNYLVYPTYDLAENPRKIPRKVIKNNSIREAVKTTWYLSHLKTFYAGLFKQIKEEDLKWNGEFFKMTYDQAIMLPMAEMAGRHIRFIKDVLYLYNRTNPLCDDKVNVALQQACKRYIQTLPRYSRLDDPPFKKQQVGTLE